MSAEPEEARAHLVDSLIVALVDRLGVSVSELGAAVRDITTDWSIEMQTMRAISDPHDRFVITTPWEPR